MREQLWAVHAQGPDDLYAAFDREDAEKHAAELNALPVPEGISVGAVVIPSPWAPVDHWQYLAEQEREHVAQYREHMAAKDAEIARLTEERRKLNAAYHNKCSQYEDAYAARDELRAKLAAQGAGVPGGYQIVPQKPTIEMVEAGYEASLGQPDRSARARVIEQYDAMLEAAPAAPHPVAKMPELVECDACPTSGGCVEVCMRAPKPERIAQGDLDELMARLNPTDVYTCDGKGGRYEKLGYAEPAGTLRTIQGSSGVIVYRDLDNHKLYFRDPTDFTRRMGRRLNANAGEKSNG